MKSKSVMETIDYARSYAKELNPGDVVCLTGDLGAGKTHFVKGVAAYFGVDPDKVNSPTFTLIHEYAGILPVYHFDCYRMENEHEALEIGAEEYFYGEGISVVEWPERIKGLIPENARWITIRNKGNNEREIIKKS